MIFLVQKFTIQSGTFREQEGKFEQELETTTT